MCFTYNNVFIRYQHAAFKYQNGYACVVCVCVCYLRKMNKHGGLNEQKDQSGKSTGM